MGYDVTYHPISRKEIFEWYFEPLHDDAAIDRLAGKYGFLAENYRHYIMSAKDHIADAARDASFESVHGLMIAVGQGLMRRYDYFRGCLFTNLVEEDTRFKRYVQSFAEFVPDQYKSMRFAGGIEENWCGGVFIPPEAVGTLIHDIKNDLPIREAILRSFGSENELNRFLDLLYYAEGNRLGILEATEVVFPFAGNCMSDFGNCEPGFMDRITVSPFLTTPNCFDEKAFPLGNGECLVDEHGNLQEITRAKIEHPSLSSEGLEASRTKRKHQMRILAVLFTFFTLLEFGGIMMGLYENRHEQSILKNGVAVEAKIERHLSGRRPYVEYTFPANGKEFIRKAPVTKKAWAELEGKKTVSVRYLPNSPEENRLASGDKDSANGNVIFWVGCFGTPFFFIFFVMTFFGYDFDQRNGVMYLLKPGQVIEDRIAELAEREKGREKH